MTRTPTFASIAENVLILLVMTMTCSELAGGLQVNSLYPSTRPIAGNNVTLICDFDISSEKLYSVMWFVNGSLFFRYVFIDEPIFMYFPVAELNVEVSRSNESAVFLRNVSLEHSGEYMCSVSTRRPYFETEEATLNLQVINEPRITSFSVPRLVFEGSDVILRCEYDLDGEYQYAVKWYKNGKEFLRFIPAVSPPYEYFKATGVHVDKLLSNESAVFLRNVSHTSSGEYMCQVSTEAPSFTSVQKKQYMAVEVETYYYNMFLRVPSRAPTGADVILRCDFDLHNKVLYSVKWYRNGVEFFRYVPSDRPPLQYFPMRGLHLDSSRTNGSAVFLLNISRENSGLYMCEVEFDAPALYTFWKTKYMDVYDRPGITLMHVPNSVTEGDNTTLRCEYNIGSETLYSLKWYKDDSEFVRYVPSSTPPLKYFNQTGVNIDILQEYSSNGLSVNLLNLSIESSGNYTCEVQTDKPHFRQMTMTKRMEVAPKGVAKGAPKEPEDVNTKLWIKDTFLITQNLRRNLYF